MKILCKLGLHDIKYGHSDIWYYHDTVCVRCEEKGIQHVLTRYINWAELHTMHPLAWPYVIIFSVVIWWDDRNGPKQ